MLARDAVIVTPLTTRMRPIRPASLMQGTSTRTIPVQEIVLAVNREDAAGVTEAVDMGLEIIATARSGGRSRKIRLRFRLEWLPCPSRRD